MMTPSTPTTRATWAPLSQAEVEALAQEIVAAHPGWTADVDVMRLVTGDAARGIRVAIPQHAAVWQAYLPMVYSREGYLRFYGADDPAVSDADYADAVAREALRELPANTRIQTFSLPGNGTLACWRSYRGSAAWGHETLTGAASISIYHTGLPGRWLIHLRPGWTEEQFLVAARKLATRWRVARREAQEVAESEASAI